MGAGKSTVARRVAAIRGVAALDLDQAIEEREGRSVARIFAEDGEAHFRSLEVEVLAPLLGSGSVIALGGGAYMTPAVRDLCAAAGATTVYLHASPVRLLARLDEAEQALRPMLADQPLARLTSLYAARDPIYRTADVIVDVDGATPDQVADEVVREW